MKIALMKDKRYRLIRVMENGRLLSWHGTLVEIAEQSGYEVSLLMWIIKKGKHFTDPYGIMYMIFEIEAENDDQI